MLNPTLSMHTIALNALMGLTLFLTCMTTSADPNLMGINIDAPLDWEKGHLYANVISVSRPLIKGNDENSTTAGYAPVDANGWPMADFSFYVWADIAQMHGTYTLTFQGQATVTGNPTGTVNLSYDPATNTSRGTIQYTDPSSSYLALIFENTKRTASSAVGSGVTSIKLMRPLTPGSAQSYPPATLFASPSKTLISKFSVIRFVDFLATSGNAQMNWSDRSLPSWASFQRQPSEAYGWMGIGAPWEHVILLANETGKDVWINIPVNATDAYILNVARMFAYGSDGVNPYQSVQTNPVYPPLNSNLKVYVEYSTELYASWNFGSSFTQGRDNCQAASNELVSTSGNSPLNWDGTWNNIPYDASGANNSNWNWQMCTRRAVKRSVEISNTFRSVFGDSAMTTRIRPVFTSQLGDAGGALFGGMQMLLNYYNNMAGNFVTAPRPPSYYFYGAGGSGFYGPAATVSTLDEFFADPGMNPAGFVPALQADAWLVAAMGLKRVAYEGGPELYKTGGVRDAVSAQAVNDPRMTTAVVNMHNAWSQNSGELLVYYRATGDYDWGFTSDIYNLSTRKLLAIDSLNTNPRAALTLGTSVPGSIAGNTANACSRGLNCNFQPEESFTADGSQIIWASYTFRSSQISPWMVNLSVTIPNGAPSNPSLAVYVDGNLIGTQSTSGGSLSFNAGNINPGLHGVIVRAVSGSFTLNSVAVASSTAPGAPVMGSATAGNAQATVTFSPPSSDGGSTITSYRATSNPGNISSTCTSSPCTVTGLTNNTAYTFTVTATNSVGTGPASAPSNSVTPVAPDTTPPTTPSSLSAIAVSSTQINLTWNASTDNVGVTGYRIYRGGALIASTGNVTSYSNTGLSPSTSYTYTVSAIDAAGNASALSAPASATTSGGTCSTAGNTNAITLSNVPSRLNGVAPLAVFFDATATTATTTTRPFHDLEYRWDFGDPLGSLNNVTTWNAGSGAGTNNRNSATGPVASHVFERAGTYTIKLSVTDGTNSVVNSCVQVVVQNPDQIFSGNNTICVGATMLPTQEVGGCPTGAATLRESNFATVINTYATTGKRVLFKRGDTFTASTTGSITRTGPGIIGAFGAGAAPRVQMTGNTTILGLSSGSTPTIKDWRIMDLEFDGLSRSGTVGMETFGGINQVLVLNLNMHDINSGIVFTDGVQTHWNGPGGRPGHVMFEDIAIVNSTITPISGIMHGWRIFASAIRLAVIGNTLGNVASSAAMGSHVIRTPYIGKGVISNNTIARSDTGTHALKMHGPSWPLTGISVTTNGYTEQAIFSDNRIISTNNWPVAIGPENAQEDQRVRNIIIERNWFTANSVTHKALVIWSSDTTIRNNICDMTGAEYHECVRVEKRGIEPSPTGVHVYNNTYYSGSYRDFTGVSIGSTVTGTKIYNNLASAPLATNPQMVSDSGTGTTQGNNLLHNPPSALFVNGNPVNPADFRLKTLSNPARDTGLNSIPVFSDFFRTNRPLNGVIDRGAVEGP